MFANLLSPLSLSWGQKISTLIVCCEVLSVYWKPPREEDASRRNMLWERNKCKILCQFAILPRKRSEKLKEHAWVLLGQWESEEEKNNSEINYSGDATFMSAGAWLYFDNLLEQPSNVGTKSLPSFFRGNPIEGLQTLLWSSSLSKQIINYWNNQ